LVGALEDGSIFKIVDNEAIIVKQLTPTQRPQDVELLISNGKFWGATQWGGLHNKGVIYSINLDGTGYTKVHDFSGGDGAIPLGGLVEFDGKLWGIAGSGGSDNNGVIYSIGTNGSDFQVVHNFDNINGKGPIWRLSISNGQLWGTTSIGGSFGFGTIFSYSPVDGFQTRHSFNYQNGGYSFGTLLESNARLWGVTLIGGQEDQGVIFSIALDGTDFRVDFDFKTGFGIVPIGGLIESNGRLWGTTTSGGISSRGTVYSIDNNGEDYQVVHTFSNSAGDKGSPRGRLLASGGYLWGASDEGGDNGAGFLYKVSEAGDEFTKLYDFKRDGGDGRNPWCSLTESNGRFWGGTGTGGETGNGTLFSISSNGTDYRVEHHFGDAIVTGWRPNSDFIETGNSLVGTAQFGGNSDYGVVYSMEKDGSNYSITHHFDFADGTNPLSLVAHENKLWGIATSGGQHNKGTIFSLDTNGGNFEKVYDFDGEKGAIPQGKLVVSGNLLWGVATDGNNIGGNIFNYDPNTGNVENLHNYSFVSGVDPTAGLTVANGKFWGVTGAGTTGYGVVYTLELDGSNYTVVHEFDEEGCISLNSPLVYADGKIWGTTECGKVLYSIDEDGDNYSTHLVLGGPPRGGLTYFDGKLFGVIDSNGTDNASVFSINTDGSEFQKEVDLGTHRSLAYGRGQLVSITFNEIIYLPPPIPSFIYPIDNSVISYDGENRFEILTTPSDAMGADGDNLSKTIEILDGTAVIKNISVANDTRVFVGKNELSPHTTYTMKVKLSDGTSETAYTSISFSTPNTSPPALTIVRPANGEVIVYIDGEMDIVTFPDSQKDADGDNLFKNMRIHGVDFDTLINAANATRIYLRKPSLRENSVYTIEGSLTDGIESSQVVSTTFRTPANPVTAVSRDTLYLADGIRVYPNPFVDQLTVESSNNLEINIFAMTGQRVFDALVLGREVFTINLSSGNYILIVYSNGRNRIIKRIVKK